jgi:tetrahydromethanopterin S-methyltransferase subunit G
MMADGEETGDRLGRIEERLDRIESLVRGIGDGRQEQEREPGGKREPLDVEQAQERLDDLGQRIEETRRNALGREADTEIVADNQDPAPEGDVEQANEVVGEGPPAPG